MGPGKREKWRCRVCRGESLPVKPNDKPTEEPSDVFKKVAALEEKLMVVSELKISIDSLLALRAQLDKLVMTIQGLQMTVTEVQTSVEFFASKYDTLLATCNDAVQATKTLEQKVAFLEGTIDEQASMIDRIQWELNESEQYSRLSNLEISGLPVQPQEDLRAEVAQMAETLEVRDFNQSEIASLHRLSSRQGKIPVVLVRFSSPSLREKWLQVKSKLRTLNESHKLSSVFVNENLTRMNSELFWKARIRGKEKSFKFVWVKNGKVFARKEVGASVIKIASLSDIDKMT
ncbi:uncharacterized protein LOC144122431 [Amblyomma americanum]